MGPINNFKRGQLLKFQKINKYNRKSSGGGCPQFTLPRSVPGWNLFKNLKGKVYYECSYGTC